MAAGWLLVGNVCCFLEHKGEGLVAFGFSMMFLATCQVCRAVESLPRKEKPGE